MPAPLAAGHSLGQSFTASKPFRAAGASFPTWQTGDAALTLALFRDGPGGERIANRSFENVKDNSWLTLDLDPPQPAGIYYLEASGSRGKIGWWGDPADTLALGEAFADGKPVAGDRMLRLGVAAGMD